MEKLQEWANNNSPSKEMLWHGSFWNQIVFVRDYLARILSFTYEQYRDLVYVDGEHTSKSIKCPVYFIQLADMKIWMRYNFYNWNISIDSNIPIDCDFLDIFHKNLDYCFCEGMADKKFSAYDKETNNKKFTICIGEDYGLYTFFWILKKFLKIELKK